jgi:replication initiation and membrane attachment protein DnaB
MEIERPNQRELTVEEQQEFEKFKQVIERATADGVITRGERDQIAAAMRADGKVTIEELALIRTLIQEKVASGELVLGY